MMKYVMLVVGFYFLLLSAKAQAGENAIIGKWMYEQKDLIVDVYKINDDYKAKIAWFHDKKDTLTPINQWIDKKNPDKALRNRKVLGMDILSGLAYNASNDKWTSGKIYDATSGRTWDAEVWLSDPQTMQVRGYYVFRFIGKTMTFKRLQQ